MARPKKERIEGAIYERHYIYNFHYHLIWVTKYRKPLLTNELLKKEMENILIEIAKDNEIVIEEMTVMEEHVHLLISFKPKISATTVVKAFKGISSRRLLEKHPEIRKDSFWGNHLWSKSYYMSTLGNMSKDIVEKYIRNQSTK